VADSLSRSDRLKFWIGVMALTVNPIIGMCCALVYAPSFPSLAAALATLFGVPVLLTVVTARLGRISVITTATLALLTPVATLLLGLLLLLLFQPQIEI
jgi:hypothetical protein